MFRLGIAFLLAQRSLLHLYYARNDEALLANHVLKVLFVFADGLNQFLVRKVIQA